MPASDVRDDLPVQNTVNGGRMGLSYGSTCFEGIGVLGEHLGPRAVPMITRCLRGSVFGDGFLDVVAADRDSTGATDRVVLMLLRVCGWRRGR